MESIDSDASKDLLRQTHSSKIVDKKHLFGSTPRCDLGEVNNLCHLAWVNIFSFERLSVGLNDKGDDDKEEGGEEAAKCIYRSNDPFHHA